MASLISFFILSFLGLSYAASKDKPHSHQGVLEPFNGKHISYSITKEQDKKLVEGQPVVLNERKGKSGRGFVLQDVQAPISICSQKIGDLRNYHKMVPHVRGIDIYEEVKFPNGTTRVGAKFNVGALGMRFGYFIKFTHEPKYNTYTWTLDYKYSSDFDDTVGHWQIMPHPTNNGWSRVLYSTMIKLPSWIPEFIVTFLTNSALVESTTWVKKESEAEFKKTLGLKGGEAEISSSSTLCYSEDEAGSHYDSACFDKSSSSSSHFVEKGGPGQSEDGTEVPAEAVASQVVAEEIKAVEIEVSSEEPYQAADIPTLSESGQYAEEDSL